jgi:hypothetical protein
MQKSVPLDRLTLRPEKRIYQNRDRQLRRKVPVYRVQAKLVDIFGPENENLGQIYRALVYQLQRLLEILTALSYSTLIDECKYNASSESWTSFQPWK